MIIAVVALALMNLTFKAVGPALLAGRTFPARVQAVIDVLPSALLGALLAVDLLGAGWKDADPSVLPGLGAAVWLRHRGRPHLVAIVAAVVVTALFRLVTALITKS